MSGSRRLDLLAFLLLACLVVGASYGRLRVYHQVTVWEIGLTRVEPNGARQAVAVPEHLRRSRAATREPTGALARLERDIRRYVQSELAEPRADPATRFEWLIRYSHNSTSLDRTRVLVFRADGSERPPADRDG